MKAIFKLFSLIKNYKVLVALNILCNILTAIFTILTLPIVIPIFQLFFEQGEDQVLQEQPAFSFSALDDYVRYELMQWIQQASSQNQALLQVCLLLITLFFLKNLFQYLSHFFMAPARNGIIRDLRAELFLKINHLPMSFFTEERKGDIIARMSSDVYEVEWSILTTLERIIRDPLIVIGAILFMLTVSIKLTLFVLAMLLFTGVIIGGISSRLKRQSTAVQNSLGRILSNLEESLNGNKVIKVFSAEKKVEDRFSIENNHYSYLLTKLLRRRDLASPLSEVLGIAAVCCLFVFGAGMVFNNEIESEIFLAYLLAFFYTITPSKGISSAWYNLQKGMGAYERITAILDLPNPIEDNQGKTLCQPLKKEIEIQEVSFRYHADLDPVLKDIHLTIRQGESIALVGESGSGKSTLADLILRLHDPTAGQILYDGINLKDFSLQTLRKQFGVVTQQPVLFHTTIADNISFGSGITDQAKIEDAARKAHAHDFIMELPKGYATSIGDDGKKLSGGQRQRIALARAILIDPAVLILDEATSALDSESEHHVQAALVELLQNRTAIVVAHRLSTIQHVDRIVVLKDGRIVEEGNHRQLTASGGAYKRFVDLQQMSY